MAVFFAKSTRVFLSLFMVLTNIFSFATGNKAAAISNQKENCKLSFATMSDLHIDNYGIFDWLIGMGLHDIEKSKNAPNAIVFNGDVTNLGSDEQYERFSKIVSSYDLPSNKFFSIGNHDTWCASWDGSVRTPEESITRFSKFTKEICGIETAHPYYSSYVNGYKFIILGSEGNSTGAVISDEQISWFQNEMDNVPAGQPVFVFLHQSINQTHGLPYNWEKDETDPPEKGGIGDKSDDILNIVKSHRNTFYISGHIHAGFSKGEKTCYSSVEKYDGYTLINLPCYSSGDFSHGGCWQIGTGYVFEVYENEVLIRARNYITGTWFTKYDEAIPLTCKPN